MAAAQAGMYTGIVVGSIILLGICIGILYNQHRKDMSEFQAREQVMQERMQQVVDMNLPPFYVDHELDPVCVYEHELPPDAVLPIQPILVHSFSHADDDLTLIPFEGDSLVPSPFVAAEMETTSAVDNSTVVEPVSASASAGNSGTETSDTAGTTTMTMTTNSIDPQLYEQQQVPEAPQQQQQTSPDSLSITSSNQSLGIGVSELPSLPSPTALRASSPSLSLPMTWSPRILDRATLEMARLPAPPPSYDVPNRVVDRSPLGHPGHHHHHHHHQHSYSASDASRFMQSPESPNMQAVDYFGHHAGRARAHTFSHSTVLPTGEQPDLPATPRYSLEFPSHVPHERHLEEHQRARAQYARWLASTSFSSPSSSTSTLPFTFNGNGREGPYVLHNRSHSQPYYPSSLNHSTTTLGEVSFSRSSRGAENTRPSGGARARAATLGESSKLLIQKMHQTLWKKSFSASQSQSSSVRSGQSSLNASSVDVSMMPSSPSAAAVVSMSVGLQEQGQQAGEEEYQEDTDIVVIVAEPGEEEERSTIVHSEVASPPPLPTPPPTTASEAMILTTSRISTAVAAC
ncbi:hypothetical protein EDD11_006667 [Mortierella claussenii]|nr:hypothetical protein EDD11_006667 [Mortierella claussenii]